MWKLKKQIQFIRVVYNLLIGENAFEQKKKKPG